MKIAILSDIHGNDVAFEAVVNDLQQYQVNCVVFLGDLVAKGPQPMECYDRMKRLNPLVWLKGNTEYWLDNAMIDVMPTTPENVRLLEYYDYIVKHMDGASMDHLIGLKDRKPLMLGHFEGLCCHGSLDGPDVGLDPSLPDGELMERLSGFEGMFVLAGHSHVQFDKMVHGVRMINPGAVGIPNIGEEGVARYAVMDAGNGFKVSLNQVTYDASLLRKIEAERKFPGDHNHHGKTA